MDTGRIRGFPDINLSPNDAYRLAVSYAGFVTCPRDPNLFLELMQVEWRAINHDGVDIDSLTYNGDAVVRYRRARSPYQHKNRLWPIHYDPRDPSRMYFQAPDDQGTWHTLRWTHAPSGLEPFTDRGSTWPPRRTSIVTERLCGSIPIITGLIATPSLPRPTATDRREGQRYFELGRPLTLEPLRAAVTSGAHAMSEPHPYRSGQPNVRATPPFTSTKPGRAAVVAPVNK